jgi:hypothetical protein
LEYTEDIAYETPIYKVRFSDCTPIASAKQKQVWKIMRLSENEFRIFNIRNGLFLTKFQDLLVLDAYSNATNTNQKQIFNIWNSQIRIGDICFSSLNNLQPCNENMKFAFYSIQLPYKPVHDRTIASNNASKRTVVLGDLLGDYQSTVAALYSASIINEKLEWISGRTTLVQLVHFIKYYSLFREI